MREQWGVLPETVAKTQVSFSLTKVLILASIFSPLLDAKK
jgi:hypothetical protein